MYDIWECIDNAALPQCTTQHYTITEYEYGV